MHQVKWLVAVISVSLLLKGCATGLVGEALSDQDQVAKRAQERWGLLIEGRLESAYDYLATGYRQVTPFPHYLKTVKGVGLWKSAQIEKVACEADACRVEVRIRMEVHHLMMKSPVRTDSVVREQWVKGRDGVWGFLPTAK
ncbi:MAG: hypothetical protein KZQ95_05380 [Candidatus Thiodiazotropha sp. (ex Epidulcina cf. delphinae)]|nr:hypothetical protein [Candidatus Thiodiazotropha sp. (ex Epidulcina cf. delphinae)]